MSDFYYIFPRIVLAQSKIWIEQVLCRFHYQRHAFIRVPVAKHYTKIGGRKVWK